MDRMEFETIFKNRLLTKGEIKNIWQTIDSSHNDKVEEKEWKFFHSLFIKPFEDCDGDEDYILNKDELGACLESDKLKNIGLTSENAT